MGKKKRGKQLKKKSNLATLEQQPKEKDDTSSFVVNAPRVTQDSHVNMASIRQYVKKEHIKYMRSEGDELPDDFIEEFTSVIGNAVGVNNELGNVSRLKNNSNVLTSLLNTDICGKSPRCFFDKNMVRDLHAWCIDDLGNVCDYPDDQNQHGDYSTMNIVRRPWDAYMVAEALPYIDKHYKKEFFDRHPNTSNEEWIQKIQSNKFPLRNCFARAKILRDSQPKKYALVIGSLGYKQCDGTIFWEFG